MTETDKDLLSPSTPEQAKDQNTAPAGQRSTRRRMILLLVGLVLFIVLGLAVIAILDALVKSPALARATPTPAFADGKAVRLIAPEYGPVTVRQVTGNCEPGLAFGQVPSGSDARIADGYCYNRQQKSPYHLIALDSGAGGWVAAGNLVSSEAYTPPTPTATIIPTLGPTVPPTPTALPTSTPVPAPLPPGSTLSVSNWDLRVDRVETASTVDSTAGDDSIQAAGRFALIHLAVTNTGLQPAALHASRVLLQDAAGNEHRNHDLASAYASSPGCADFVLDLEPGATACLIAAMDVPLQPGTYALSLTGATRWVLLELP